MQYLSDVWIAAANRALSSVTTDTGPTPLVVVQHVVDARSYLITLGEDGASLVSLDNDFAPENALTFTQNWATACGVAQSVTDAHQAFLLGDIAFTGDIATLIDRAGLLEQIAAALAPVMEATTFPAVFAS